VRSLVLALGDANLVEAKTDSQERLKRLELEAPDAEQAKSKRVRVEGADGRVLADVVIGKTRYGLYGAGRGGVYVRDADATQAWLADRQIEVPEEPLEWLDRTVLDLPAAKIATVELGPPETRRVRLVRSSPDAETLTLAEAPEGREVDPEKVGRVTGLLGSLSMQDVRPAGDLAARADATRARFTTLDGAEIEVAVVQEGEGDALSHWAVFDVERAAQPAADGSPVAPPSLAPAAADPGAANPAIAAAPAGEAANPVPDAATAAAPAAEAASGGQNAATSTAELGRKLEGWAFKLPPYLAERLGWGAEDFLKPADKTS
jgi:hypothetical protein